MKTGAIFLSLAISCFGQLIYPDDSSLFKSTIVPYVYSTDIRQSVNKNIASYEPPQFASLEPPALGALGSSAPQEEMVSAVGSKFTDNALQEWSDHVNNLIANGVFKFALDVEREIHRNRGTSMIEQQDNIIFSPLSITVTLAIVLAGSAGKTFEEVSRVLGLELGVDISRHSEIVHQMFGLLTDQFQTNFLTSTAPKTDFALATYVQDGYPILEEFRKLSTEVYKNDVINVDFAKNGQAAQNIINSWVSQKTKGKIMSILNSVPSPDTMLILLSALYFNGEWNQHFLENSTKRKPFFIEPNNPIQVDMMYNGGPFPFYEDKQLGVKILGLPYKGKEMTMYILFPKAEGASALRNFLNGLSVKVIENLINNMKNETCIIGLPRMKLSSSLSLRSTLANLGMSSLFDPKSADLSLISQPSSVYTAIRNNVPATPTMGAPVESTADRGKSMYTVPPIPQDTKNVLIFNRFGSEQNKRDRVVKRNYFTYEDPTGYTVEQWSNGFTIRNKRVARDTKNKENRNSYVTDERPEANDKTTFVNLEENKYRFQDEKDKKRSRRQSRPIDEDFLNFVKQKNFPSYGLDNLRNTANLVNPHLFASDVLHKVEIDITEKGTEAAAVTGVVLERDGSQKRLIANRPFVFFIRHDPTKLVLFWGTVNTPTPKYPAT
ncbi:leukocyte elastase inhibitor-like [Ceratina calcarata]|uniref:Leukocyte elastase inhibitor-like n=1 Tax=Ceratina calcarata TaxID=156304 RepID=A0AAJ7IYB6_9HYME|nr:leukocyte elastase inhibitor-like [Ceratina calcarata]